VELFEFAFETGKQREGIGAGASETGQDTIVVEAAHLAGARFHDGVTHGDLAVGGHGGASGATHEEHGCATKDHLLQKNHYREAREDKSSDGDGSWGACERRGEKRGLRRAASSCALKKRPFLFPGCGVQRGWA